MKKLVLLIAAICMGTGSSLAASSENKVAIANAFNFGDSFIFVENGITFSVYPDGEFDFYIDRYAGFNAGVAVGPVGVTFNSGFNYNPYVQYDDYGAVLQVEGVPVFYDFYGRVRRIGDIRIRYRNGLAYRIGGMRVFYNPGGFYSYHTGFINVYNRGYFFQPFHRFFVRPAVGFCLVYPRPYRRFYDPIRYTYYGPYYNNYRRSYARIGRAHHYYPRSERSRIYRNDRRVAARSGDFRYDRNRAEARRTSSRTENGRIRGDSRTNRTVASRDTRSTSRSQARSARNTQVVKSNRKATASRSQARSARNTKAVKSNRTATASRSQARSARNTQAVKSNRKATASRSQARSARNTQAVKSNRKAMASRSQARSARNTKAVKSNRKATVQRSSSARKSSGNKRSTSKGRSTRSGRH